jgi:hypothetical protein
MRECGYRLQNNRNATYPREVSSAILHSRHSQRLVDPYSRRYYSKGTAISWGLIKEKIGSAQRSRSRHIGSYTNRIARQVLW